MKKLFLSILLALTTVTNCIVAQVPANSQTITESKSTRQYNTSGIFKNKKLTSVVNPNNANFWNLIEGFDQSGKLKQVYIKENVVFVNNTILLQAINDETPNPLYQEGIDDERIYTKTAQYSGGKITLKEKFLHGHITFLAKFPNSSGTMPAFWLFDEVKGVHYTEVDAFEIPGSEKQNMYTGVHWGIEYKSLKKDFTKRYIPSVSSKFRRYDIYKTPTKIVTLVDGQLIKEINLTNKKLSNGINGFNQPLSLIINMNVGDGWGGAVDETEFPHNFEIKNLQIKNYKF